MNGLFRALEDEAFFVDFVREQYVKGPNEISSVMWHKHVTDDDRIRYAFGEYTQNVSKFAVLLHSENPDHYKRAGALLHALYQSEIITALNLESNSDELEAGFTRVNVGDAEHVLPFVKFYEEFANQMAAFNLAYRCCAAYEENPRDYDFDYLHNVCRYLKANNNLSVDSLFILFKSLMK